MDITDVLRKQQKRSIAMILSYKEQHVDPKLTKRESDALRKVILDQFNNFYNLVLDTLPDAGMIFNDEVWEQRLSQIDDIHKAMFPEIPVDPRELGVLEPDWRLTESGD